MIKLLFCVDDMVILTKSVFSEISQGYDRLLASSRVAYSKRVLIIGLSCPSLYVLIIESRRYFSDMSWFEVPTVVS